MWKGKVLGCSVWWKTLSLITRWYLDSFVFWKRITLFLTQQSSWNLVPQILFTMVLFVYMNRTRRYIAPSKIELLNIVALKIKCSNCEFWEPCSYHTKSCLQLCAWIFYWTSQYDNYFKFFSLVITKIVASLSFILLFDFLFICSLLILKCCSYLLKVQHSKLSNRH